MVSATCYRALFEHHAQALWVYDSATSRCLAANEADTILRTLRDVLRS
ncbi:MAG: PAS domain-containing protein [Acidimicrobiia bacterium]|nr:PAS domain-containing protein [Acidimicrobiia bacterium]